MQRLNLFFLLPASTQLGGCTSFTLHLHRAFKVLGFDPVLYRIGSHPTPRQTSFPYGLPMWTVPLERALIEAQSAPSLIVYCFWRKCGVYAKQLMTLGVPMVLHDPAEFHDEELALMRSMAYRPLVIRKANVLGLRQFGIEATYAPHPYVPINPGVQEIRYHGLSLARLDFRKRTHIICEANAALESEGKAVHLFGEVNRMYEYHQLRKLHPNWKQWYHGEFPATVGSAVHLFAQARYAVDLTQIRGDGGGTQYTFFEAWDAGIPLILNRAWSTAGDDEVRDGDSCLMVQDAAELTRVLRQPPSAFQQVVQGGARVLRQHGVDVARVYLEVMHAT